MIVKGNITLPTSKSWNPSRWLNSTSDGRKIETQKLGPAINGCKMGLKQL
jgi:hypothetical protein